MVSRKRIDLVGSLLVDFMGMLSYVVPVLGEAIDIATAPLNVAWIFSMLSTEDTKRGRLLLSALGGIEELAPFIDFIPSASIAWMYKYKISK